MPPRQPDEERSKVPKPKDIKDVPRWLRELTVPFFTRLSYIFRLVYEAKKSLLFLMVFISAFNGAAPVVGSLISARILNALARVYSGAELAFGMITLLLVFQFAYMFLNSAVTRIYSMLTTVSGELVANHVKMKIMEKAKSIDMVSYDMPDFYSKMENANREAGMRPLQILSSTFSVASSVISMISYIIVLFSVSFVAPLLIIAVSIPATVINFIFRRKNADYMFFRSKTRRQMDYYSGTVVNKDMAKEIRILGLGDFFCDKYRDAFSEYFDGLKKLQYRECFWNLGASVLTNVVYCLLYIFLARGVFRGAFEVGSFSLYTGAITAIGNGVGTLITTTAGIYEGTLFINNLIAFLSEKPGIVSCLPKPLHVDRHHGHAVEFEDVCFRYPGTERDVLKNVSFTIDPAEAIVIVGLNGAGKTTLVKLLTRLYDPTGGRILLDGHDIRQYDPAELYAMFGIVFQDFGKYAVSVSENIVFGNLRRSADHESTKRAAEQSGAAEFISRLPDGYETPLMRYFESNGVELSVGQWQKLAIARAFYSDSDILILDEPTASLDPMAEQEIFNRFNELRRGKTSIFISHRLSSATTASRILVIEDGRIIESGSHVQLMRDRGRYYELFTTQASRYVESAAADAGPGVGEGLYAEPGPDLTSPPGACTRPETGTLHAPATR